MTDFAYSPMFPLAADDTEYERISGDHVELVEQQRLVLQSHATTLLPGECGAAPAPAPRCAPRRLRNP